MPDPNVPYWAVPAIAGEPMKQCRSCSANIVWRQAPCGYCGSNGKVTNRHTKIKYECPKCNGAGKRPHPVDEGGGSHFATCPEAARHRAERTRA